MGSVLFWILVILKIIGLVLLFLLAIVLFFVLLLLFTPIRYRMTAEKQDIFFGEGEVSWLFGMIRFFGAYHPSRGFVSGVSIFGRPLKAHQEEKEHTEEPELVMQSRPAPSSEPKASPPPKTEPQAWEEDFFVREGDAPQEVRRVSIPPYENTEESTETYRGEEIPKREEESDEEPEYIQEEGESLWRAFQRMPDKRELLDAILRLLRRLFRNLRPQDIRLSATIGTGDPATTGMLLGAAGMVRAKFGNHLEIKGEFRHAALEDVVFFIKGRLLPGGFFWTGLRFLAEKPVRRYLWQRIRAKKKGAKEYEPRVQ